MSQLRVLLGEVITVTGTWLFFLLSSSTFPNRGGRGGAAYVFHFKLALGEQHEALYAGRRGGGAELNTPEHEALCKRGKAGHVTPRDGVG